MRADLGAERSKLEKEYGNDMMYKDAHATTTPSMARGAHSCKSIVVPEVDSFIDGEMKVFLFCRSQKSILGQITQRPAGGREVQLGRCSPVFMLHVFMQSYIPNIRNIRYIRYIHNLRSMRYMQDIRYVR